MCDNFTLSTPSVKRLQYASKCMYSLRTCKVCQLPAVAAVIRLTGDRAGCLESDRFPRSLTSRVSHKSNFLKSIDAQG